jgi:WD40 repeat protein
MIVICPERSHRDCVLYGRLCPDGRVLASGSTGKTITLWDAETGTELATLRLNAPVSGLAVSPDGHLLAAASSVQPESGTIRASCSLTGQSLSRAGKISSCVNWLSAREKIGPVNEPLTSQSTCLFNRFAPLFGKVTIGRLTDQNPET